MAEHLTRTNARPAVAVIGGGYAGMAAAVDLARHGHAVEVFESGPVLGGRARRVTTQHKTFDNGQHILIGAYTQLLALMQQVGAQTNQLLYRQPLTLYYPQGFHLSAWTLPAPLHLASALLFAHGLRFSDRWRALRFMQALQQMKFQLTTDCSVSALLTQHQQSENLRHWLWDPLCIAALNTAPEEASAQVFVHVLRDSLAGARTASDLLLPRTDLSALFPEPAAQYVLKRGGKVHTQHPIRSLDELRQGFSHIIVAVGPHHLAQLMPQYKEVTAQFSYRPIYTVWLQYNADVQLPQPMIGLVGGATQWAFDRGVLCGESGLIGAVISAQGPHESISKEQLIQQVHAELAPYLPIHATPHHTQVIAEKRATMACTPHRPHIEMRTTQARVFLAGDYVDADYPPTLEAAVRSGLRASAAVCAALQNNATSTTGLLI